MIAARTLRDARQANMPIRIPRGVKYADKINALDGARGRTRTDTLLKAVDFHLTSAFAALSDITQVRGLEHAFTLAARL
jgi:hypothetical protein